MNWAKTIIVLYFVIEIILVMIFALCRISVRYTLAGVILVMVTHFALIAWVANA